MVAAEKELTALQLWVEHAGKAAGTFLVKTAIAILIYIIIFKVLKRLLKHLNGYMEKKGVAKSVRSFTTGIIKYGVLFFTIVTIVVQLDIVESASIAALLASAGVGISLAAQGALSNMAGGLLLLVLKPFKEGDFIMVQGTDVIGTVDKIAIYYTSITTIYNEKYDIPNSELTGKAVKTVETGSFRRIEVKVGISYEEDIRRVEAVLQELLDADERILKEKQVYVDELGAHAVIMGVRGIVKAADFVQTKWDLNKAIRLRFAKEDIQIPYEQLDVHVITKE
ncbi:MAG: mechanosensitive ion channel [Lachnospiraceae bacterium]|nr:mechanosensitive ion channel [Lachnospiraceae bacterium]